MRTTLSCDDSESAEVGSLLNGLGDQVRSVAATQCGPPVAQQLGLVLNAEGVNLAGEA